MSGIPLWKADPLEEEATMQVERIQTGGGSHIEPPLDESWSDLEKLRWQAAVVEADTGIRIRVNEANASRRVLGRWVRIPGQYQLGINNGVCSSYSFDRAWVFMVGASCGARAALSLPSGR